MLQRDSIQKKIVNWELNWKLCCYSVGETNIYEIMVARAQISFHSIQLLGVFNVISGFSCEK